jgi:ABC-2 type transport system permease protein
MTLTADRWPAFVEPDGAAAARSRDHGVLVVWGLEVGKISRQVRVQAVAVLCLVGPFLALAGVKAQSAVPQDTLFGQWLHESGFALPLVVVGFTGQWVLPLLTAIVAGDMFASEDHYGTWKTVLTRSRTRGDVFAGKVLAAVSYTVVVLALLAFSSLMAGLALGTQPVVGLSGQLVPAGHATTLVVATWATQLPPILAYCALALLLSVASRNVAVGIGAPVVLGLVMQVASLVNLPATAQAALLSTPFAAWHGLWVASPFYGPLRQGLITCVLWFGLCLTGAWVIFRRRAFGSS